MTIKEKLSTVAGLVWAAAFATACSHGASTMNESTVFPKGDQAPAAVFTNTTWVKMLHADEDGGFDT